MIKRTLNFFLVLFLCYGMAACGENQSNIEDYDTYIDDVENSELFMPKLNSLGEYKNLEVYHYSKISESINLIVTYDHDEYEIAKTSISNSYSFLIDPIFFNDVPQIPETEFEYKGFLIRVVDDLDYVYPEYFGMIGYNNDKMQISYSFYSDGSRFQISSMSNLLESNFKFSD